MTSLQRYVPAGSDLEYSVEREESAPSVIIRKLSWNFFVHAGRRLLVWFEQFFFFFCFILVNIWGTEASQRAFGAKMTSY